MATQKPEWKVSKPKRSVIQWLLDSDPSIRWQVMRDLTDEPEEVVAAERSRVASEGWRVRLLGLQTPGGHWGADDDEALMTTVYFLVMLKDLGVDPASEDVHRAIGLVRDRITWWQLDGRPYFDGETEPCINRGILAAGAYFGEASERLLDRLFGEVIDRTWTRFSFPTTWHYDVLRGLDYLRSAGVEPDERVAEAVDLVAKKQHQNGRWPLQSPHPNRVHFDMEGGAGEASRWNTLRALRVLDWYSA